MERTWFLNEENQIVISTLQTNCYVVTVFFFLSEPDFSYLLNGFQLLCGL